MMTSNHQHSYLGLTIATGIRGGDGGGGGGGVDETETIELYTERTMDESAVIVENNGLTTESKSIHSLLSSSCATTTTTTSQRGSDEVDNDGHDQHGSDNNDNADDKNDDHHVRIDYATAIKQSKDSGVSTTTAHHDSSVDEIPHTFHTVKRRDSSYASSSSTSSADDSLEHDSGHSLARSETNRIRLWKVMVIVTIVAVAAVVSSGTFIFLGREEDDDYRHRVRWDTDFCFVWAVCNVRSWYGCW
jgi:hypothetical protein